ncbi:nicotinamide riboside transporter PnuC [Zeaxanthinibacter sp. PT1]|uniref:nicotinamide riboside transporter PnuC n=1 Tax=Zeaxanthinibacter TaxID=561554 RepID=UPI00234A09C0|nr:nicotinamide riboside transporter PnuC [Zeaxanthinibacter sp. PT1]MDC6351085.1 nicotinamide riboside transporter PnuC [Zeaxanthinibacter sp. PT1]
MSLISDWIFAQYEGVDTYLVILEMIGVLFGFLSVWYAKRENILVFPTGIISTAIFVYILAIFGLIGDMLINAYYFSMSIIGWYNWTRKVDETHYIPITTATSKEKKWSVLLFIGAVLFVTVVYFLLDRFNTWTAYVDTLTTAIFFVGMWLMAKKKLENWVYWIIGDLISVPLYWYKGLIFTSLQYFLFTLIAIFGYLAWKKDLNKSPQTLLR